MGNQEINQKLLLKRGHSWLFKSVGLLMLILVLAGCNVAGIGTSTMAPSGQITRTLPPVGESRGSALFTATVGVPPTPAPTRLPDTYDYSVLTESQKDRLYRASLEYLADTEAEAVRVARGLRFVENEGHPANFCGPLSIAILRDAGLVDRYTDLHNFWLLNPRDDYTEDYILEKTFPRESYLWYQTTTSINEFDFNAFPLFSSIGNAIIFPRSS